MIPRRDLLLALGSTLAIASKAWAEESKPQVSVKWQRVGTELPMHGVCQVMTPGTARHVAESLERESRHQLREFPSASIWTRVVRVNILGLSARREYLQVSVVSIDGVDLIKAVGVIVESAETLGLLPKKWETTVAHVNFAPTATFEKCPAWSSLFSQKAWSAFLDKLTQACEKQNHHPIRESVSFADTYPVHIEVADSRLKTEFGYLEGRTDAPFTGFIEYCRQFISKLQND